MRPQRPLSEFAEFAFGQDAVLCFIQPRLELLQQRQALFLTCLMASGAVALFVLLLYGVEFAEGDGVVAFITIGHEGPLIAVDQAQEDLA